MSTLSVLSMVFKVFGILGAGFSAGYAINTSSTVIPVLVTSALPPSKIVRTWNELFDRGAIFAKMTIPTSGVAFLISALFAHLARSHPIITILGIQQAIQLTLAGGLLFTVLPFTLVFVFPTSVYKLKACLVAIEERTKLGEDVESTVDIRRVRAELADFSRKNLFRAAIFTASLILGATAHA
ncbi:hypothetical protein FRB96_000348 [Tulasnella sp. 330]|nr:hypothetical protein FRB96_000348 [Tulasnella sp. 330]KAG8885022.1 hypothetical protein FRB97_002529 [Tulasnella sp. 331]KAG8890905.1 hypothetical protein FRB98_002925 [Tulasnella sp. 332]